MFPSELKSVRLLSIDGTAQYKEQAGTFFYKNLDLTRYYFYMLSVYLHQIVFAELGDISIAEPRIINCVEQWPDGPEKQKLLRQKSSLGIMKHFDWALPKTKKVESVDERCEEVRGEMYETLCVAQGLGACADVWKSPG